MRNDAERAGDATRACAFTAPQMFVGLLDDDACDRIIAHALSLPFGYGLVAAPRYDLRRCDVAAIDRSPAADWIHRRLAQIAEVADREYQFGVGSDGDVPQYCEYRRGDRFDWHLDCGPGAQATRKLSITVQLSSPADYDGGALEFVGAGELPLARERGTVIAFPAFLGHRVRRIRRGCRRALVAWFHGKPFC